ncbi:MAG TPA: YigZ family protein [Chitinophagales bacterium]|mgnify:CR=1 FL=1|nr:YigZ family protein [Chitinophagales bacterium]
MSTIQTYQTIHSPSTGSYSESGSKFLAFAQSVNSEQSVRQLRDLLHKEHHKAVHVVFASRIGWDEITERSSDDGEPAGSAGKPVLNAMRSFEVTQSVICVVRYFGGKKLGIPGLIHAYKAAAEDALTHASLITITLYEKYQASCSMEDMQGLLHQLNKAGARVVDSEFGENSTFRILIPRAKLEAFHALQKDMWQTSFTHLGSTDDARGI